MRLTNLLNSPRKIEVLKILKPKATKRDIESELKLTPSRLSQILGNLEKSGLVERRGNTIQILPKGEIVLEVYEVLSKFNIFFEKFGDFINEFDLSDLPSWLVSRVYELDSIEVVRNTGEIVGPCREFFSVTSRSSTIKGYTPVFFSEYVDFFLEMAKRGIEVSIIVSDNVLSKIISDFSKKLEKGLSLDNVRFYVSKKKYRFTFVITDAHLLISFYLKTGVFDYMRSFVCRGDAIRWGNDLFEFIRGNSEPIDRLKLNELLR